MVVVVLLSVVDSSHNRLLDCILFYGGLPLHRKKSAIAQSAKSCRVFVVLKGSFVRRDCIVCTPLLHQPPLDLLCCATSQLTQFAPLFVVNVQSWWGPAACTFRSSGVLVSSNIRDLPKLGCLIAGNLVGRLTTAVSIHKQNPDHDANNQLQEL